MALVAHTMHVVVPETRPLYFGSLLGQEYKLQATAKVKTSFTW